MDRDVLRPELSCFQFQRFGLIEKIPRVVVNSFDTEVELFT